jgi:hypothetical protein
MLHPPQMAGTIFFMAIVNNTFICQLSCVKPNNNFYRVIRQRPKPPDWHKKICARHALVNTGPASASTGAF